MDFQADDPWKPVLGPGVWGVQLLSVPIGLIAAAAAAWLWSFLVPVNDILSIFGGVKFVVRGIMHLAAGTFPAGMVPIAAALLSAVVLLPAAIIAVGIYALFHELIHIAAHPRFGSSERSILGVWPAKLVPFAYYSGELSRARYLTVVIMPLLVLSFIPLLVCGITGRSSGVPAFISILNVLGSSGDILVLGLLLFQVPGSAVIRGQGGRSSGTFWRFADRCVNKKPTG